MNPADCIFCKIIRGEIPSAKLYEDEAVLAFLDIRPINPGHALVIPKKHFENMHETPDAELGLLMAGAKKVAAAVRDSLKADGINVSINNGKAAGQVVFHTHVHIIPRYLTDGLKSWEHGLSSSEKAEVIAGKIREAIKK